MNLSLQIIISRSGDAGNMAGIMSAAILSLFVVFVFVAVLHCYTRWCLAQGGGGAPVVVVGSHRLLILRHLLHMDNVVGDDRAPPAKGLDPRVLSSIPVFVHVGDCESECVICLSLFESGEKGRRLPLCGHVFHIGCIDMWLHSHATCPVCRAPAACADGVIVGSVSEIDGSVGVMSLDETRVSDQSSNWLQIVVEVPDSEDGSESGSGSNGKSKVLSSSNQVE